MGYASSWNVCELATHAATLPSPPLFFPCFRDCLPLDAKRKPTTGSAQERSRCNSRPMTASSPGRRKKRRDAPAEGLTRWYELPRDLTGSLSVRVPPRRLGIRYIHARRLIKYSFAANGTTRSLFRALVHSLSTPFLRRDCLSFLPSSLPFSLPLPLSHMPSFSRHTLEPLYSRA